MKQTKAIELTLFGLVFITAFILISFTWADAEEFDETECVRSDDKEKTTVLCYKETFKDKGITITQDDLTEEEQEILDDIEEARENGSYEEPCRYNHVDGTCYKLDETPEIFGGEPDPANPIDPRVEICTKKSLNTEEYELCRLLEAIDECHRGFGKLEVIQEVSSFEVTLISPTIWENFDLKYNVYLKSMLLAYEECRAIQILHDDVLSAMYWDFVVDGIMEPQLYHGDIAKDLIPVPTQRLTEKTLLHTLGNAYEVVCYNQNYKEDYKIQQGCQPQEYEDDGKPLPNQDRNMDDYYNSLSPMQRFKAYQEDPHGFSNDQFIEGNAADGDWKGYHTRK